MIHRRYLKENTNDNRVAQRYINTLKQLITNEYTAYSGLFDFEIISKKFTGLTSVNVEAVINLKNKNKALSYMQELVLDDFYINFSYDFNVNASYTPASYDYPAEGYFKKYNEEYSINEMLCQNIDVNTPEFAEFIKENVLPDIIFSIDDDIEEYYWEHENEYNESLQTAKYKRAKYKRVNEDVSYNELLADEVSFVKFAQATFKKIVNADKPNAKLYNILVDTDDVSECTIDFNVYFTPTNLANKTLSPDEQKVLENTSFHVSMTYYVQPQREFEIDVNDFLITGADCDSVDITTEEFLSFLSYAFELDLPDYVEDEIRDWHEENEGDDW